METPQYKVLQDSFMEPNHVKAGSIIRTWGPPGPHLEPMNESAEKAMEAWYEEEHDEIDAKTGKATGQKVKPHLKFRVRTTYGDPGDRHAVELVSGPAKDQPGSLSLAETLANPKVSTDQRPPPQQQFRMPGSTVPRPADIPPEALAAVEAATVAPPAPEETPAPESEVEASGGDGQPEPEPTEVVVAAPPPSAKRIT